MDNDVWKDKIEGMFLGIAIGDALGMPVEQWTLEEIKQQHGRVEDYLDPGNHKWFSGKLRKGMWTDDTQLTLVMAESLIAQGKIDMKDLAKRHVKALEQTDVGWGGSTRDAVKRLQGGMSWVDSGFPCKPTTAGKPGYGMGNGVVMKIAPVAAYIAAHYEKPIQPRVSTGELVEKQVEITCMTHHTRMAFSATHAHTHAIYYCLRTHKGFSRAVFKMRVRMMSAMADRPILDPGGFETDRFPDRMIELEKEDWTKKSAKEISDAFGQGTSYVYNSLPFSYAFFLKAPDSIETLYEVVSAGGDTDSNGSIVGGLLGALNGKSIFPKHPVDGLWQKDRILETAKKFCERFDAQGEPDARPSEDAQD